jgi:anti-sigma B factor antagonist
VSGEIDLGTADQFRLDVLGADLTGRRVVFELAGVTFMDSSGLAVLLEASGRAAETVLHEPSPIVRRIIEATGVEASFIVRP